MMYENTVSFNASIIDQLNQEAQQIDNRLYLFAYYRPKQFSVHDSSKVKFYTAVINLYGLLNDCGSFVIKCLFNTKAINGLLERNVQGQLTGEGQEISRKIYSFNEILSGLRNSACHNNALEYANNKRNIDNAYRFYSNLGFSKEELTNVDWEKCLNEICKLGDELVSNITVCLNRLKASPDNKRERIIDFWINEGLCRWFTLSDRKHDMLGYLDDLKQLHCRRRTSFVPLNRWLDSNFGVYDYTHWLNEQTVKSLLNDKSLCPKPAYPIDVFKALTMDVYEFAMQ